MKASLGTVEHIAFVICMMSFGVMAFLDYSRDGDRVSLALALTLAFLTALSTYFWFAQSTDEPDDKSRHQPSAWSSR